MMVLVVVVMIVLVVIIVLEVVVDGCGSGCNSFSGCVLISFISYVFKSSVYFQQCCNLAIDQKKKKQLLKHVLFRLHSRGTLSTGL